jgi:hypothetical protein
MTESNWLRRDDLYALLQDLPTTPSNRKLRLFGVACLRRLGRRWKPSSATLTAWPRRLNWRQRSAKPAWMPPAG